jgi:hypothetical protein
MKLPSQQRGYISEPMRTRKGICYLIRYRVPNGDGSCTHKSERLYVASQREARALLEPETLPGGRGRPPFCHLVPARLRLGPGVEPFSTIQELASPISGIC